MSDWIKKLNDRLTINENEILEHAGKISHEMALQIAVSAYEQYNAKRIKLADLKALETLNDEMKELAFRVSDPMLFVAPKFTQSPQGSETRNMETMNESWH